MRILFCDDEAAIIEQLQSYVREYFVSLGCKPPEFAAYTSGEALLAAERKADLAFLDVKLPGIHGIQVGAALKTYNPHIKLFIVTAYPDYLDEAMRFQVFRYLSKPIDKDRLFRNLKDALYQYHMETKEFPVLTGQGVFLRRAEEIVCVEAAQRKTMVYTTEGLLQSTQTMEDWRQILTLPCFSVPHRSFIINMRFVNSIQKDAVFLKWGTTEKNAYLTKRKYSSFKEAYLAYLESVK